MSYIELLLMVLGGGLTAFILFLLGYAGYSIIKHNKRKQLKQERKERIQMEQYIQNMDNDLKQEIDSAVREHNKKIGVNYENNGAYPIDDNFSNDLLEKIKNIVRKGLSALMNKGENKYRYLNEKYNFDKDNEMLHNIKDVLQQGMDKFVNNIDKWDNVEHKWEHKWKK